MKASALPLQAYTNNRKPLKAEGFWEEDEGEKHTRFAHQTRVYLAGQMVSESKNASRRSLTKKHSARIVPESKFREHFKFIFLKFLNQAQIWLKQAINFVFHSVYSVINNEQTSKIACRNGLVRQAQLQRTDQLPAFRSASKSERQ